MTAVPTVVAIHHPAYRTPVLLATPLVLPPELVRAIYRDRWAVEQVPLAAKQMVGAARQFVHAPETCQRLPELALVAGSILSYAAATLPATPGRLRRVLGRCHLPHDLPLLPRLRPKASVTDHLPTGWFGQRRRPLAMPDVPTYHAPPAEAA